MSEIRFGQTKCPQCGSLYELDSYHVITRDSDSIECDVCGATIKKWSGSRVYSAKLLKAEPWPKKD